MVLRWVAHVRALTGAGRGGADGPSEYCVETVGNELASGIGDCAPPPPRDRDRQKQRGAWLG
eukprot:1601750-Rhodomonas_salina.1